MVFDAIKKSLFASIGLVVVTGEQIRKTVENLVEAGKMTADQGEALIDELMDKGQDQRRDLQERIMETVRAGLDNLDIGSKREFRDLALRVKSLEDRLALIEALKLSELRKEAEGQAAAKKGPEEPA